jgi:hypothetical protein
MYYDDYSKLNCSVFITVCLQKHWYTAAFPSASVLMSCLCRLDFVSVHILKRCFCYYSVKILLSSFKYRSAGWWCHVAMWWNNTSPWRCRQHGPPKFFYPNTSLYGVTTQKAATRIFIAVKASNFYYQLFDLQNSNRQLRIVTYIHIHTHTHTQNRRVLLYDVQTWSPILLKENNLNI